MEETPTVNLNESSIQNLATLLRDFVMRIPYPEVSLVAVYTGISFYIIYIVFCCFSKDLSIFEYTEPKTLLTWRFTLGSLLSAILKIITSYLYYIIITELQSLYKNLYIYCLIRAIPLLMIFISFFVFLITLKIFPISFRKVNKFNMLGLVFYLSFILELVLTVFYSLIVIDISLKMRILILIIENFVEVLHIIYILILPRLIFPYNAIENGFNTDFEGSHLLPSNFDSNIENTNWNYNVAYSDPHNVNESNNSSLNNMTSLFRPSNISPNTENSNEENNEFSETRF